MKVWSSFICFGRLASGLDGQPTNPRGSLQRQLERQSCTERGIQEKKSSQIHDTKKRNVFRNHQHIAAPPFSIKAMTSFPPRHGFPPSLHPTTGTDAVKAKPKAPELAMLEDIEGIVGIVGIDGIDGIAMFSIVGIGIGILDHFWLIFTKPWPTSAYLLEKFWSVWILRSFSVKWHQLMIFVAFFGGVQVWKKRLRLWLLNDTKPN